MAWGFAWTFLDIPEGDLPLFITLQMPGPPASVLCGGMSGMAFVAHEPLPSISHIVFNRVPGSPKLDATNHYFYADPGAIAADFADLGFKVPGADRLDAFTRARPARLPPPVEP